MNACRAWRVRRLVSMAGEGMVTGADLFRPLAVLDNALLVCAGDSVVYAGTYDPAQIPPGVRVHDLGEATMTPAAVNAHTHIQLAHLAGQTLWGQGFVPWLRSLIPLLAQPLDAAAMGHAVRDMVRTGTAHAADFTSHGMALTGQAAQDAGLGCTLLAEWFGFAMPQTADVWPPRCLPVLEDIPLSLREHMAPAGHALYSTRRETLHQAHAWCCAHGRPFAMHLAEFPEEVRALVHGDGPLVELYAPVVLPRQWRAPGLPPVPLAEAWGLLGPETLAVHCVQCGPDDAARLAGAGVNVCLCPRSNALLAVGEAPVDLFVRAGLRLCLGTDGLTSNTDMDVWQDALFLLRRGVLPAAALLRLLTCNGAAALRRDDVGSLQPGRRARWALLPPDMEAGQI